MMQLNFTGLSLKSNKSHLIILDITYNTLKQIKNAIQILLLQKIIWWFHKMGKKENGGQWLEVLLLLFTKLYIKYLKCSLNNNKKN